MAEELDAQVRECALADPAREVGLCARKNERGDAGGDEHDDDEGERVEILGSNAVVHGDLREVRREQRHARIRDEGRDRERGTSAVRASEAKEDPESATRLTPGPVLDAGTPLVHQVAAELPDLHETACLHWGTPAHHPLPA